MNDDRLDELLAQANPISDATVAALDLGAAEAELLEEIRATARPPRRHRHHRRLVGAVAASVVAVAAVGAGLYLLHRDTTDDEVQVTDESTTTTATTADVPSPPPPPPSDCDEADIPDEGSTIPPAEVPDEMRVLPTWTPDGIAVTSATGQRWAGCPGPSRYPADSALELVADHEGDGVVDATIYVDGPLPDPLDDGIGVARSPTQVRGLPGIQYDPSYADDVAFAWTEPDGWSWQVHGSKVDEATVRALVENLVLDSSPEGDEPAADLPPAAMPAGFTVDWQLRGAPVFVDGDRTMWSVIAGEPQAVQTGTICRLDIMQEPGKAPLSGGIGSQTVEVNGELAIWGSRFGGLGQDGLGYTLTWELAPDVLAHADCSTWDSQGGHGVPLESVLQFAESVVPVAADDPRIPQ